MKVLTKSRFKLGLECANKLFFAADKNYANQQNEDSFLQSLAEGGFQVEAFARLHYPQGKFVTEQYRDYQKNYEGTQNEFKKDCATIYEAAFLNNELYAMTDIVVKKGNHIKLVEVKAKSFDSSEEQVFLGKRGGITSTWRPYLFDLAFQTYVAKKCFPSYKITSVFILADKSKKSKIDGLNQFFRLPVNGDLRKDILIKIDAKTAQETSVLTEIDATAIVAEILQGKHTYNDVSFEEAVHQFKNDYLTNTYSNSSISYSKCKNCEFKTTPDDVALGKKSGFEYCFNKQLKISSQELEKPTIFELWNFRGDSALSQRKLFLEDLEKDDLKVKNLQGQMSASSRRWVQVEKAQQNDLKPFVLKNELKKEINSWQFPLHFIDFETSAVAIPFNKNTHPYEQIAFQFSHHTVDKTGKITHQTQYLNSEPGVFPNFLFLRALKQALDNDKGTIFRFASHENSILNAIKKQLENSDEHDKLELIHFIESIAEPTGNAQDKWTPYRQFIDLREVILNYYYHPLTKGSNSIKAVLPAILKTCEFLKNKYTKPIKSIQLNSLNFSPNHVWLNPSNLPFVSPYKMLPETFKNYKTLPSNFVSGLTNIADGGAALTAYSKLQFKDMVEQERALITESLLKYCELDTLAMVMLYEHLQDVVTNP